MLTVIWNAKLIKLYDNILLNANMIFFTLAIDLDFFYIKIQFITIDPELIRQHGVAPPNYLAGQVILSLLLRI